MRAPTHGDLVRANAPRFKRFRHLPDHLTRRDMVRVLDRKESVRGQGTCRGEVHRYTRSDTPVYANQAKRNLYLAARAFVLAERKEHKKKPFKMFLQLPTCCLRTNAPCCMTKRFQQQTVNNKRQRSRYPHNTRNMLHLSSRYPAIHYTRIHTWGPARPHRLSLDMWVHTSTIFLYATGTGRSCVAT